MSEYIAENEIKDFVNNQEIRDAAMDAAFKTFPEEITNFVTSDSFNEQIEKQPLAVLIYCSAVKAYAQANKITEPPTEFPDLTKLMNEDSERGLIIRTQMASAHNEYCQEADIGGGAGINRLLNYVDKGYTKQCYALHVLYIAEYGLKWEEKEDNGKSFEIQNQEAVAKGEELNKSTELGLLTNMVTENYGEFLGEHYKNFETLIKEPASVIAMAEYISVFSQQYPNEPRPTLEELQKKPDIKELSDTISVTGSNPEKLNMLPDILDGIRKEPQLNFKNEKFLSTENFEEIKKTFPDFASVKESDRNDKTYELLAIAAAVKDERTDKSALEPAEKEFIENMTAQQIVKFGKDMEIFNPMSEKCVLIDPKYMEMAMSPVAVMGMNLGNEANPQERFSEIKDNTIKNMSENPIFKDGFKELAKYSLQAQTEAHALYGAFVDNNFENKEDKENISKIINERPSDVIALGLISKENEKNDIKTRIFSAKDLEEKLNLPEVQEVASQLNSALLKDTMAQSAEQIKPLPELSKNKDSQNIDIRGKNNGLEIA